MQKTTILTFTLLSLGILPVMAQLGNNLVNNNLGVGQVWTDFQSYSTDLQNYLQNNLSENLKPVEPQSRSAITGATGELNIPNPIAAGQSVRDQMIIYSVSDRFENNSAVRSNLVSNEINRLITRGAVTGVLGEKGQIRTKAKLKNTEASLKNIAAFSNEIEGSDLLSGLPPLPPNPVVDASARFLAELLNANQAQTLKIQQEQSKIVAETFAQTLQTNQSLQYSNLNLANISQQVEEENRDRRVNASTEAARLLRVTSQVDLFGRKN
ncbi:hypothetical protein WKK05_30955 [Nostoc sp. UHCC 0302]|uniref:hypothetical protein n=1 Tax=Nostoc sp. UHCC 0302 TaxID=3134896 RepID=UPI00311C8C02